MSPTFPATETRYPELALLIDGTWRGSQERIPVINPADESVLGMLPCASASDIHDAIDAAERGFAVWRDTAPAKRAEIVLTAARLIRERLDNIAYVSTLEQGKPLAQSRAEVLKAISILEWDANESLRLYGRIIPAEHGMRHLVLREPIGVVAGFSPWNYPVSSPARKIAGALSAGCSIILKASEETPAGAIQLAQAFIDAGLPPGVFNLLFGQPADISETLIPHPSVRMIAFTGSVPVGKHLASLAGRYMKRTLMELGGHGPVVVCGDVDPVRVAGASVEIKTRNAGQVCVAPTRWIVHDSIYEAFLDEAGKRAADLRTGNGLDASTQVGPLANQRRVDATDALVQDALSRGARLIAGGKRPEGGGFYYPITVLADLPEDSRVLHEEPFGPIMLVQRFGELDEAIALANGVPFGLASYAFTGSAATADRLMTELECGNLAINHFVASLAETPFGGVKDSGYGREGGAEGLYEYTTVKNVSHRTAGW